tara:strand:- start:5124 stop:6596 length:1473 start_codon:yes stop_codon:yes gene_type:complete
MRREIKSHQDIHDYIVTIEADFPVDTWSVAGVHVWPHLRIKIYYALIQLVEGTSTIKSDKIQPNKISLFNRCKTKFIELLYYFKAIQGHSSLPVMFSTPSLYRVQYKGLLFHKFFDAMVKAHHLEAKITIIEMQGAKPGCYNPANIIDGISLRNGHRVVDRLIGRLSTGKNLSNEFNLPLYDSFLEHLRMNSLIKISLDLEQKRIIKWGEKVKSTSILYKKLFKNRCTRRFISISYYGYDDMAAALFAANALGLETVDFQHGPQTNVHMAYSSWTKIPEGGFNTMPKVYWNWDQKSSDHIRTWWKQKSGSRVTGHPWLAMTQNENQPIEYCDFLYTLQLISNSKLNYFFPEQILKLMGHSNYSWILRIHPRDATGVGLIRNFLEKNEVPSDCYSIEHPLKRPLITSLNACKIHITNYSGCAIEARILKKKTLVIDKTGYLFYKNYIDDEFIFYLDKHNDDFADRVIEIYSSRNTIKKNLRLGIFNPFTGL